MAIEAETVNREDLLKRAANLVPVLMEATS
jgi:hypothetical protein